jgi:hypothetical protein
VPEVIVQRHAPRYEFLVVEPKEPETTYSVLERFFGNEHWLLRRSQPGDLPAGDRRLEARPLRPWSFLPSIGFRLVPSVAGSNVYVRIKVTSLWPVVVLALLVLAGLTRAGPQEILAPSLFLLAILAAVTVILGVLEAKRVVVIALSDGEATDVISPWWTFRKRIGAAAFVAALALTALAASRTYIRHRDAILVQAAFAFGEQRQVVVARLGKPDVELAGKAIGEVGTNTRCIAGASTLLAYIGSRGSHLLCLVYLNAHGRVLCVEHGVSQE